MNILHMKLEGTFIIYVHTKFRISSINYTSVTAISRKQNILCNPA